MKHAGFLCVLIAGVGLSLGAQAQSACRPTPSIATTNYPGAAHISSNNNLVLPTGKSIPANGQKLIIAGHVLDNRCMPVVGAIVEMWQPDPFGRWAVAKDRELATPEPTFAGAGRAMTDEDGEFQFVTAFPSGVEKRAPHINLRIYPEGMPNFSTVLYFSGDRRNVADPVYRKQSIESRRAGLLQMGRTDGGDLAGMIDIVLPNRAPYISY